MGIRWKIHSPEQLALSATLFLSVPILTYFFATRRALFIRIFAPKRRREEIEKQLPQGDQFRKGMRIMAGLQLLIPLAMYIGAIVWWYRQ